MLGTTAKVTCGRLEGLGPAERGEMGEGAPLGRKHEIWLDNLQVRGE